MENQAILDLVEKFPEIIDQMPTRFNSHEFIMQLAQTHQTTYIDASIFTGKKILLLWSFMVF